MFSKANIIAERRKKIPRKMIGWQVIMNHRMNCSFSRLTSIGNTIMKRVHISHAIMIILTCASACHIFMVSIMFFLKSNIHPNFFFNKYEKCICLWNWIANILLHQNVNWNNTLKYWQPKNWLTILHNKVILIYDL